MALSHALIFSIICGSAALAQTASTESDDARYTFSRADDGYLRLDGRTGQVSMCTRRSVGWACQAVPDERTALESEIARLQAENVALKRELLAHNLPLPQGMKSDEPAPKNDQPQVQLPKDMDVSKILSAIENVWRRLVDMIAALQRDVLRKT
jgi:hypothetical protein